MTSPTPPSVTERTTIPGKRRHYEYVPATLEEAEIFADLSVAAYAAAQALTNISAVWSREDHDTLFVTQYGAVAMTYV